MKFDLQTFQSEETKVERVLREMKNKPFGVRDEEKKYDSEKQMDLTRQALENERKESADIASKALGFDFEEMLDFVEPQIEEFFVDKSKAEALTEEEFKEHADNIRGFKSFDINDKDLVADENEVEAAEAAEDKRNMNKKMGMTNTVQKNGPSLRSGVNTTLDDPMKKYNGYNSSTVNNVNSSNNNSQFGNSNETFQQKSKFDEIRKEKSKIQIDNNTDSVEVEVVTPIKKKRKLKEHFLDLFTPKGKEAISREAAAMASEEALRFGASPVPQWETENTEQLRRQKINERKMPFFKRTKARIARKLKERKIQVTFKVTALIAMNMMLQIVTKTAEFENIKQMVVLLGISASMFYMSQELSAEGVNLRGLRTYI